MAEREPDERAARVDMAICGVALTIAEAVIYLIEHQLHCTIIPTAELEALRQAAQPTTQ